MTFHILPYTEIDGIRTVQDSDIKALFKKTQDQGLDKIVFYEGTIQTPDEFLAMAKNPGTMFFVLIDGTETVGYAWLNRFENRAARQHFCFFQEYWGKAVEFGRQGLKTILDIKDLDGKYLFDLLTGFVPAWNERAIKFSLKCGGKTYGEIPNAIWNESTQKSEPAVFIYYTRGHE